MSSGVECAILTPSHVLLTHRDHPKTIKLVTPFADICGASTGYESASTRQWQESAALETPGLGGCIRESMGRLAHSQLSGLI